MILGVLVDFIDSDPIWKEKKLTTKQKNTDYSRIGFGGIFYSFVALGEESDGDIEFDKIREVLHQISKMSTDQHDITLVIPNKSSYKEIIKQEQYNIDPPIKIWLVNSFGKLTQMEEDEPDTSAFRKEGE